MAPTTLDARRRQNRPLVVALSPRWCALRSTAGHLGRRWPVAARNSCYVAICPDESNALALLAVLNSPLAEAWLAALAEPARGGYRRYLGWTMSLLPLPLAWESACSTLAPISRAALSGSIAAGALRDALLEATLAAYGLQHDELAPLLAWFAG